MFRTESGSIGRPSGTERWLSTTFGFYRADIYMYICSDALPQAEKRNERNEIAQHRFFLPKRSGYLIENYY